MKNYSLLALFTLVCAVLIAQNNQDKVINRIDRLLYKELKKDQINNIFLSVYSPSKNFEWNAAKGKFKDGRDVSIQHPFYTASVGKTFTASAIGILVDEGKVKFEDKIIKYLPKNIMHGLHVFDGVDYSDSINISHLLSHTSGLADYFGKPLNNSTSLLDSITVETGRLWKPVELINYYKTHFKPLFPPGGGYYYTDTEYILLGLIIEEVSGKSFHEFITDHILTPLELNHTYLNLRSTAAQPTFSMAEIYSGEREISAYRSLSADWAGGAIVSTGKDLIHFQQALREGKLVSTETFKAMQNWVPEEKGMVYGYGLRKISFRKLFFTLPKWTVIGHSGLNGTFMYYSPELDVYLAGTLNQLEASKASVLFMVKVLLELNKL